MSANGRKLLHQVPGCHEYDGVLYPKSTPTSLLQMVPFLALTPDDVLIATYPKSGTTWLQEILYLIYNGADPEEAKTKPPGKRVPFVEVEFMWPNVTAAKPPRLLKTHLRANYFEEQVNRTGAKVIFVLRNPKDTLVSYYHFYQKMIELGNFEGSWSDFFELIKADQLIYGDWLEFTLSWWELRNKPNVLVIKYEDMKVDHEAHVKQIAAFCGKELTQAQVDIITNATSFSVMKTNPINHIKMRKGQTGDWKNYFTPEQNEYVENMYIKILEGKGLRFDYGE